MSDTDKSIPCASRSEPKVPVLNPLFVWTRGADVQATWRKHGWVPPSEMRQQMPDKNDGPLQTSQL